MNRALFLHTWRSQRLKILIVFVALTIWGALLPIVARGAIVPRQPSGRARLTCFFKRYSRHRMMSPEVTTSGAPIHMDACGTSPKMMNPKTTAMMRLV